MNENGPDEIFTTADAGEELLRDVMSIVRAAFDGEFSDDDGEHSLGGWHIVAVADGRPAGHVAVVPRAIEIDGVRFVTGYLEAVAVLPDLQRSGIGFEIVARATGLVREHFELGALSTGLHEFYRKHGWELWLGSTYARGEAGLMRTPNDDGGVMVLRFGVSAHVDLSSRISCDARTGDHW